MSNQIFRIDEILQYCKGKSVLHLGFVQHSHQYEQKIKKNTWLHAWIAEVANRLVGIDYLRDDVERIKEKYGYEGYFGDANDLDHCALNETFDVIICGELIEHITNPGLMLEGIKRFMKKDSLLVITTPNVWAKVYQKRLKKYNGESWVNREHVHWYSYFTLSNTVERHGFEKVLYEYYFHYNTRDEYFGLPPGFVGKLKKYYRNLKMNNNTRSKQIGLFFIVKQAGNS